MEALFETQADGLATNVRGVKLAETIVFRYEDRLAANSRWAMSEGSRFFEGTSVVQQTLGRITSRLREVGIEYAVVGGMALFHHGYRRFTEDVDLLVTPQGLREIHRRLQGLGYLPPFEGSKNLRDTESGVKIEFLITGGFPGDGKPKPVAFPAPSQVSTEKDSIWYIRLPKLVELKLASGINNPARMKDLADVLELIRILNLPKGLSEQLHPFVQEKYQELWKVAHPGEQRYVLILPGLPLQLEARSLQDIISQYETSVANLRSMLAEGVTIETRQGSKTESHCLVTTDSDLARKYGMHDETEFMTENTDGPV